MLFIISSVRISSNQLLYSLKTFLELIILYSCKNFPVTDLQPIVVSREH